MSKCFGLVTAGTEVMQQPGKISNALSTISARLTASNDQYIASITGGQGTVDDYTGQLRSTYDILKDLADVYPTLSSVEKQEMVEVVAGKTQRTALTSILSNFTSAVGATTDALNSEGSATEENNKRMQSLQGRLTSLQGAWQEFANNTIDNDFVKNILYATTQVVKFADAAGGLTPILTTLASAFLIFKSGSIAKNIGELTKKSVDFKTNIANLGGGLQAFSLSLAGVKSGTKAATLATTGFAGAMNSLSAALGAVGIIIGIVITAYNLIATAQKEATESAIKSSQASDEIIRKKKEEKQSLEEEKNAYIESSQAQKEASDNSEFIKSKNQEIRKRQENIDKINEEIEKEERKRKSSAKSISPTKVSGMGISRTELGLEGLFDSKYVSAIEGINKQTEGLSNNTGAYKKKLEEIRDTYQQQIDKSKELENSYPNQTEGINGLKQSTEGYDKVIRAINAELERNSENYELDSKSAKELYDMQKDGIDIGDVILNTGQNALEFMKEFYGLTDKEINKLKDSEILDKVNTASSNYSAIVDSSIQKISDYAGNLSLLQQVQESYNQTGYITADMYKSLQDADLLQYLSSVDGKLQVNTAAFNDDAEALRDNAEWALKNQYAQDLLALAIAVQSGNLSSLNIEQDNVTIASKNADTSNIINQIAGIGSAATTSAIQIQGMLKTLSPDASGLDVEKWSQQQLDAWNKGKAALDEKLEGGLSAINAISLAGSAKAKGSGGSGKSSSKSTQEEYKATIDTLYEYKNALEIAKNSVEDWKDALGSTENYAEQENFLHGLINATNNQIDKTNELKNAQTNQIYSYISSLQDQGFAIRYNQSSNELYIDNMQHLADYSGDTAKSIEKMIKEVQDLNDSNVDLSKSTKNLTYDIKDYNKQLEEIQLEKVKKFNELFKDFQQSYLDEIQGQIDDIQYQMDTDPRLKQLDAQIEALERENDELDNQKDLEEKILAVEEAKLKLKNLQAQKNLQVYRERKRICLGE